MAHLSPYQELGQHIKRLGQSGMTTGLELGEVKKTSPLEIWIKKSGSNTLKLTEEDVLVDDNLCPGVVRKAEYQWMDSYKPGTGRETWDFEYKEYLNPGDRVALIPCSNSQVYIVLARVKRYGQ